LHRKSFLVKKVKEVKEALRLRYLAGASAYIPLRSLCGRRWLHFGPMFRARSDVLALPPEV
jgi:hypothetical protein